MMKILLVFFHLLMWANLGYCVAPAVLDLSYKHYLDVEIQDAAIKSALASQPERIIVDISSSILGNEHGFLNVVKSMLSKEGTEGTSSNTEITFLARHNRITPESIHQLFQILLNTNTTKVAPANNLTSQNETKTPSPSSEAIVGANSTSLGWTAKLTHLDVGWNPLLPHAPGWKSFLKSLQTLLQTQQICPESIRFERCGLTPAACRAIGKGIIQRYTSHQQEGCKPLSLHLCGNRDIGDSGTAAIAAAIRTAVTNEAHIDGLVLHTLDLAACDIGDAGAEALALALESSPRMCIRHLDLSNNKISDVGASAIAHALLSSGACSLESLDLSGNTDIKDEAATTIAEAVGRGLISCIRLRSCHILADGASAFGKALVELAKSSKTPSSDSKAVEIDLSGNPLGVLRNKAKKDGKYSASAIKSKASATTAAYMSMLQKGIKRGLKEYGVDAFVGISGESDDEEEARSGMGDEFMGDDDLDPSKARCGIKAFANAILDDESQKGNRQLPQVKCRMGLRRCFLDHGAADALAATLLRSKEDLGVDLAFDLDMNPVLEEEMIEAIHGGKREEYLVEMSERYIEALDAMKEARERAAEAARMAAVRMREEESRWDPPAGVGDYTWEEEDDEWDSDADYEQEDDDFY